MAANLPHPVKYSVTAEERRGLLLVAMAVVLFSTSPVLIRWAAASLTSYEITAGRLLVAGVIVLGLAIGRRDPLPRRDEWPRFAGFGLAAALHFGLYIASLSYTSIAHSLALIYTAPIFVALFSWIFLKETLSTRQWIGILVAVAGVALLAGAEAQITARMIVGDLLAIGSAICFGIYSVAGRSQRDRYPLLAYAGTVYVMATLWLIPTVAVNFSAGGYTWPAVLSVLALGIFPLAIGHTLYNAALRRVSATYVNVIATQEVTGGIILGVLLLQEIPTWNSIAGALITLGGILLVVLQPRAKKEVVL